jgi:hypothetical protein
MLQEVVPGLHRWTARHPSWEPAAEPDSPDDWPSEVGSIAYASRDGLVLVDPMVADWDELDALVAGRDVAVVTTMRFHGRSRVEVAERYGARLVSVRDPQPAGIERVPIEGADETMVWIERHGALVPGDRLIGDGRGGVRMCPESWLAYLPDEYGAEALRAALRPLLDLPIERVLTSHGDPVLRDGHAAVRAALYG